MRKPAARVTSISAVDLRWSASAPKPSRKPSSNTPQSASSMTCSAVRCVRVISRMDCCARTGLTPLPRTARMWPGVARPSRSPMPMLRQSPRHCGFRYGSAAASAEAFARSRAQSLSRAPCAASAVSPLETGGVLPRQDAEEFLRAAAADEVDAPVLGDDGARIDRQPRKARELAGGGLRLMPGKRRHQFARVQQGKQSAHGRCPDWTHGRVTLSPYTGVHHEAYFGSSPRAAFMKMP